MATLDNVEIHYSSISGVTQILVDDPLRIFILLVSCHDGSIDSQRSTVISRTLFPYERLRNMAKAVHDQLHSADSL